MTSTYLSQALRCESDIGTHNCQEFIWTRSRNTLLEFCDGFARSLDLRCGGNRRKELLESNLERRNIVYVEEEECFVAFGETKAIDWASASHPTVREREHGQNVALNIVKVSWSEDGRCGHGGCEI